MYGLESLEAEINENEGEEKDEKTHIAIINVLTVMSIPRCL